MCGTTPEAVNLTTSWDGVPIVRVWNRPDGNPTTLEMAWCTAPEGAASVTVTFENVLAYRWNDVDLGDPETDQEQCEFGLIRIIESELVNRLFRGAERIEPAEWYGGAVTQSEAHHYRIAFDDHGVYDIVCTQMRASGARTPPPP